MTTIRRPASARLVLGTVLALLGIVSAVGTAGCTLLQPRAQRAVTLSLPRLRPCALIVVLFRGTATIVRTEFRTMVASAARPGEHLIVIDGATDRELGAFTAPASPTTTAPAPPTAPPRDPTAFQRAKYHKAAAAYQATIGEYVAGLRTRERERLDAWAATVLVKIADGDRLGPGSSKPPLADDLGSAVADFASLGQSGTALGDRKVLAVLGFHGPSDAAPSLSTGLDQAFVVVTGFPADPGAERAFRSGLLWEGARHVVLLTRAASSELATVVAGGLAGTSPQRAVAMP